MATERSLILLKPDCLDGHYSGEVIGRFEKAGFEIRAAKLTALTDELLGEHYAHIADRPFFPEIVEFMSSRSVLALITPPTPSMAIERSCAVGQRGVPLKQQCSTRCETPASASDS